MESATCCGMESRFSEHGIKTERKRRYTASRDAMRGRAAIPYNSLRKLIPYQALRSWINKKTNRSSSFYFGGPSRAQNLYLRPSFKFVYAELAQISELQAIRKGSAISWLRNKKEIHAVSLFCLVDHQGLEPWTDRL